MSWLLPLLVGAALGLGLNIAFEYVKRALFSGKIEAYFNEGQEIDFIAQMDDPYSVWVRVLVKNTKKRTIAHGCQAYLTDIKWKDFNGKPQNSPIGDSLPLIWSKTDKLTVIDIPYGIKRFVDVLCIYETSGTLIEPQTKPHKYHLPWFQGAYIQAELTIVTQNRLPIRKKITVSRRDGSMWHHVDADKSAC